jgi:8-oxo-dGTP diphosphatase
MDAEPLRTREYPSSPLPSVHAAVLRGDQVLLVRRANPPRQGRWSLPGGVVELGETFRQAARREVLEECGIEVEPGALIDVVDNIIQDEGGRIRYHYVLIYVLARYVGGEAHPASDASDVRWAGDAELDAFDMLPLARQAVRRAWAMARQE